MIAKFEGRLAEKTGEMQTGRKARDFHKLAAEAHWLKASAGTVGFDAFRQPVRKLEELVKEAKWSEVEGSLLELRERVERIELPEGTVE